MAPKFKVRVLGLVLLGVMVSRQTLSQTWECFGDCMGTMQVQPALNVAIDSVRAADYTDNIGPCTQITIGNLPMHIIPGHRAAAINGYLKQLASEGFITVDISRFSSGGYKVEGRTNPKQKKEKTGCNLAGCRKPLGKMKTNRDRKRRNEGCEWAGSGNRLKKTKWHRERDNEGCEWAKDGKSRQKMKIHRDRGNEGCPAPSGRKQRKAKPTSHKSWGCDLAKPGRKGHYGGRQRSEKSQCYD